MTKQFLRFRQVKEAVGLSHTTIYAKIKAGEFPKPIPLGANAVAWDSDAIQEWMAARAAAPWPTPSKQTPIRRKD